MKFNVVSQNTEMIVDSDPDLYVKRAEKALSENNIKEALVEIDKAIGYSKVSEKGHYIFEKAKILNSANQKEECNDLIRENILLFYQQFNLNKFREVLSIWRKLGLNSKILIKRLLINNSIPWVLIEDYTENQDSYYYFESKAEYYKTKRILKEQYSIAIWHRQFTTAILLHIL